MPRKWAGATLCGSVQPRRASDAPVRTGSGSATHIRPTTIIDSRLPFGVCAGVGRWEGSAMTALITVVVVALVVVIGVITSVRILKQYERGVQFRLGKVKDGARGPGVI